MILNLKNQTIGTIMKSKLVLFTAIFLLIIISSVIYFKYYTSARAPLTYGVFSKDESQLDIRNVKYAHFFTVWGPEFETQNQIIFEKINKHKKIGIITLEPWPLFKEGSDREALLTNIKNGLYDQTIKDYCIKIDQNTKSETILRLGHEMELFSTSRYPWAIKNASLFKDMYKHYIDQCRSVTNKVNFMWSPAGNEGLDNYYPGDKYVDTIGFSWYSYPAFEWFTYKKIYSFENIMDDKYNRLKKYNKPLIAAEFGFAGVKTEKENIITELKNKKNIEQKYPLLSSIIIFSDKTESWVPNTIEKPDWTLTTQELEAFIK